VIRYIADVSGAGDTVISVASLAMAAGLHPKVMALMSNLAGGLVCEKIGVVPIDKDQLIVEMLSQKI
jgi:bifunctional ADP-heptose synthase (sugar kinase/adenylyltransferase)